MTLTVQDSLEIWRISNLHCTVACSSTAFCSLWTFTNSFFCSDYGGCDHTDATIL